MTGIRRQLEIMLNILDEKEWIQGNLFEGPLGLRGDQHDVPVEDVTGVCLAGAYTYAIVTGAIARNNWQEVAGIIITVAGDLFPDRGRGWSVPYFNDHKETTEEDIRLVVKTAIEKAGQLEGA